MMRFKCSSCGLEKNVSLKYSGKSVRCPICKSITKVPEERAQMKDGEGEVIKFRCPSCNQKIGVPKGYAGRRVRCTKCKNPLEVPGAAGEVKVEAEARGDEGLQTSGDDFLDDRSGMEALLSMEAGGEAVEIQTEEAPIDEGTEEKTWDARGRLIEPGARTVQKKRNPLLIVAAGVAGVLFILLVGWYFFGDRGGEEKVESYDEVKAFTEEYIYLLSDGRVDEAQQLLSLELQSNFDSSKKKLTKLSEIIGTDEISELHCELVHFEEVSGIKYYYLLYKILRVDKRRSIILHVAQDDFAMSVSGIAIDNFRGETSWLGSDFGKLSNVILSSETYKKRGAVMWPMYIWLGACLFIIIQLCVMWVVYEMAGQPGWAAFVPIYNMYVLAEIGGRPGWLGVLAFFIGPVPVVGRIASLCLSVYISIGVARTFNRGILFGVGLNFLPFVFYPILAFTSGYSYE
jgi:hypothetical protein